MVERVVHIHAGQVHSMVGIEVKGDFRERREWPVIGRGKENSEVVPDGCGDKADSSGDHRITVDDLRGGVVLVQEHSEVEQVIGGAEAEQVHVLSEVGILGFVVVGFDLGAVFR